MEEQPLGGQDLYIDIGYRIFPNYPVNHDSLALDSFLQCCVLTILGRCLGESTEK